MALFVLTITPVSSLAQVVAPMAECGDLNADNNKRIAACTKVIEGGALEKPVLVMAHINRGQCLLAKGDAKRAIGDFDKALEIEPSTPIVPLFYRGKAHAAAGDKARAIADYQSILAINPGERNAIVALKQLGVSVPEAAPAPLPEQGGGPQNPLGLY